MSSQLETVKKLDSSIISYLSERQIGGLEKSLKTAEAIMMVKTALTPELMKPIMALQGSRLGFRTDKDKASGYDVETVKNCLVDASLMGLTAYGNKFNIIAGGVYVTKEGFSDLLAQVKGLDYEISFDLPKIAPDKTSATVIAKIKWTIQGQTKEREMPFSIKSDSYTTTDSVIGKATRKARKWLHEKLTGLEIADGDVTEVSATVVSSKIELPTPEELQVLLDEKAPELTAKEFKRAQEIIQNKEESSYSKLKSKLLEQV
jgi:hypothetical protein